MSHCRRITQVCGSYKDSQLYSDVLIGYGITGQHIFLFIMISMLSISHLLAALHCVMLKFSLIRSRRGTEITRLCAMITTKALTLSM